MRPIWCNQDAATIAEDADDDYFAINDQYSDDQYSYDFYSYADDGGDDGGSDDEWIDQNGWTGSKDQCAEPEYYGDGWCDDFQNVETCNFDGGLLTLVFPI